MCQVLQVARSGYYAWCRQKESNRAQENKTMLTKICKVFKEMDQTYGSPRIYRNLRNGGVKIGRNRVARLMRVNGLCAVHKPSFKPQTTIADPVSAAPNLLNQNFTASEANRVWTSDITAIETQEGWLFLAIMLDVFSRRVVGWSMHNKITSDLVIKAFVAAWNYRNPRSGLIVHSDRGCQYNSRLYRDLLSSSGCVQSMSSTGNCYDNAVTETFFHTLKVELVNRNNYRSRDEAKKSVFKYIEVFYNRIRMHSTLNYQTPVEFECNQMLLVNKN